jgi:hypothetical protein
MTTSRTAPRWTKGPWRASETWRPPIGNFPIRDKVNANGDIFWGYAIHGRDERGVEVLPTLAAVHNFPNNIHANARLIAAAPELYEALAVAAEHIRDEIADLLCSYCVLDEDGTPIRATLDPDDDGGIAEYEALLVTLDASLAQARGETP